MKYPDSHTRLVALLNANKDAPFEWGHNDCCLFACLCVDAMTGTDPMAAYRGKYSSANGAQRMLKKHGGGSIKAAFDAVFGPLKPRLNAQRGDLVLIDTAQGEAVGVLQGGQIWAVSEHGLVALPFSAAKGCWPVDNMQTQESQ